VVVQKIEKILVWIALRTGWETNFGLRDLKPI